VGEGELAPGAVVSEAAGTGHLPSGGMHHEPGSPDVAVVWADERLAGRQGRRGGGHDLVAEEPSSVDLHDGGLVEPCKVSRRGDEVCCRALGGEERLRVAEGERVGRPERASHAHRPLDQHQVVGGQGNAVAGTGRGQHGCQIGVVDVPAEGEGQSQGRGDVVGEPFRGALAGGTPQDFAGEVSHRQRVVGEGAAGFPQRGLACKGVNHREPGVQVGHGQVLLGGDQAGSVGQHLADGEPVFAVGGELGPQGGHGLVEVEQSLVGGHQQADGGDALAGGEHDAAGVRCPRAPVARLAAVEVDDGLPVDHDGAGGAAVASLGEVVGERVGHGLEAGGDVAVDVAVHEYSLGRPRGRPWVVDGCAGVATSDGHAAAVGVSSGAVA
jgi:hypothetical protein